MSESARIRRAGALVILGVCIGGCLRPEWVRHSTVEEPIAPPYDYCTQQQMREAPDNGCPEANCYCVSSPVSWEWEPWPSIPRHILHRRWSPSALNGVEISVVPGTPRAYIRKLARSVNGRVVYYTPPTEPYSRNDPGVKMWSPVFEMYSILIDRVPELGVQQVIWLLRTDPRVRRAGVVGGS